LYRQINANKPKTEAEKGARVMRAKEAGIPFIKLQNKHVLYESSTSSPKKNSGRATFDTFQSKVVGCNGLKPSPPSLLHSFFVLRQWPHPLKMHTC
jgi:hypothetical protein